MKKIIILLVLISLMSCGHYRWFYKHRKELCFCDTVKTIIYRETPNHNWNYIPEYRNIMPYYEYNPNNPIILDTSHIIGYDTIITIINQGTYPLYRGY